MASSWRYGKRSKYRAKVSQDPEDYYRLDTKKSKAENAYDIYQALCCRDTRDTKRLFLLNGLATLCQQQQQQLQYKQTQQQQLQQLQQQQQQQSMGTNVTAAATTSGGGGGATAAAPFAATATTTTTTTTSTIMKSNLGFSTEELFYCLSASLVHSFAQVRAAALRTIRYTLHTAKDIKVFNSLQLPHLVCRSIDIMLKNDDERVQALKLIRKMLTISPEDISPVLVRCLVSLADNGMDDNDNMLRACLATLCEFAVLNPTLLIVCGGVTSITRNVLECHNPRIAESLSGVLLYLLEWPQTRNICGVRLDCLAAPYCDFTYRLGFMDKNKDARDLRYTSCRLSLLSVLRSWTGTLEFCDPSKVSGLKAIVDALYLNQIEVRKAILDLLFELLGIPQSAWTEDYAVALQAVDPSDFQDAWLLSNGFVAMEGRSILPSLAARAPNICVQHLALQLYCFLETGLLNALVEVIATSEVQVSVRATVLVGKILQLMHTHLPADIASNSSALPTLITHATQGNQQASAAVIALQNYQKMLRNRPASCSLFLDNIIQSGALVHTRLFRRDINALDHALPSATTPVSPAVQSGSPQAGGMSHTMERTRLDSVSSSDESMSQSSNSRRSSFRFKRKLLPFFENMRVNRLIKDSNVLSVNDANLWDWDVVTTILRSALIRKLDETTKKFLTSLVLFYKPSSNRFSHQDLLHGQPLPTFVTAGLDLIDLLLSSSELESMRLLTDYFSDVSQNLLAVTTSNRAHDCLFSPQHMSNTMCQQYFLYIGRMCRTQKGISILTNTAVFEHLITLVRTTDHVCYVKLIVSGLDYTLDSVTRRVLERALTSAKTRTGRLYATQFLVVLLRARIPNFEVWGIPMIIQQTKDRDRSVVLAAIDVLEEACHEKYYLEEIVHIWRNLKPLGDVGRLLMVRYYSVSRGLNHCRAKIKEEIEYWKNGYNKRYVLLVEADTHSSLTLHVRNEDGYYSRRNCNTRPMVIPPNIPPHLYGQLVQNPQGCTNLRKFGDLAQLVEVINRGKCNDDSECLELKAAVWAVGHASTHSNGIEYFTEAAPRIYEKLVALATQCDVYSVRATAFNVLGLISCTKEGANILFKLNWLSVRHDRNTVWPVHQAEDWMTNNITPVRHHYEDMPPYNYTGIDDQIDGSYYTGSYWNILEGAASGSSDVPDANTTAESIRTVEEPLSHRQSVSNTAAKSRTLPEGANPRFPKHQRSLSESKTTDVISMLNNYMTAGHFQYAHHRIRYNSCTDSNTSGVSSCESVTGRAAAAICDLQQSQLSPIPSISNLNEIASGQPSLLRRSSHMQNAISPVDIKGYAKLRSLRRHCRPVLSESAAELYDFIERIDHMTVGPRRMSFGDTQRRLKVRSLDRQASMRMAMYTEETQVPLPTLSAPKFLSQTDSKGPCYAGICLPKNLLDLFPTRNLSRTYVSRDIQDQDLMDINLLTAKQQFLNDSLNNEAGDESSVISSLSDVSSVSKRSKWIGAKHGRSNCLHCTRMRRNRNNASHLDSDGGTTGVLAACELYTNATAAIAAAGLQASVTLARKTSTSKAPGNQVVGPVAPAPQSSSTIQLSDISFNSPESILSEESMPDRLTASILYNVQRLANPVSAKQSKIALLELKQKHPNSFQDICLYSEVCKTLGRSSYRMTSRRFMQELFLDLNFDSFYTEPCEILSRKEKEFAKDERLSERLKRSNMQLESAANANESGAVGGPNVASTSGNASGSHNPASAGGSAATSTTMSTTTANVSYVSVHKGHLKSKPLASVYESSCENLLQEQSPRMRKTDADLINAAADKRGVTTRTALSPTAPPPAAPPPDNNELHITTDDDEDEDDDDDDNAADMQPRSSRDMLNDLDEVDAVERQQLQESKSQQLLLASPTTQQQQQHSTAQHQQQTNGSGVVTPVGSSNCSEHTTNSNRSSICTISQQPLNITSNTPAATVTTSQVTTPIENENQKYRRARFYTLELDLSCTRNKFPITDRSKTRYRNSCGDMQTTALGGTSSSAATTPTSLCNSITTNSDSSSATTANVTLKRQSSLCDSKLFAYKTPLLRYSSLHMPQAQSPTAADAQEVHADDSAAVLHAAQVLHNNINCLPKDAQNNSYSVSISSLNAILTATTTATTAPTKISLAKPIGSLYCEKRLQASKSEAILTNVPPTTASSCGGGLGVVGVASSSASSSISSFSSGSGAALFVTGNNLLTTTAKSAAGVAAAAAATNTPTALTTRN